MKRVAEVAKFVVGLVTAVAVALSTTLGPDSTVGHVVTIVLAVAGAIGVYLTPNSAPAPEVGQPAFRSPTG